jgi:hypothetical protein
MRSLASATSRNKKARTIRTAIVLFGMFCFPAFTQQAQGPLTKERIRGACAGRREPKRNYSAPSLRLRGELRPETGLRPMLFWRRSIRRRYQGNGSPENRVSPGRNAHNHHARSKVFMTGLGRDCAIEAEGLSRADGEYLIYSRDRSATRIGHGLAAARLSRPLKRLTQIC